MKSISLLLALGGGPVLAEEVLMAMNMPQTIEQSLAVMKQAMPAQLAQMSKAMGEDPPEMPQQNQRMMEVMAEELSWAKIKDDYVGLYAATFTAGELRGLLEFYWSPAGRAFVAKQPALMQHSMEINQKLMLRLMPKLKEIYKKDAAQEPKQERK
ncbi:MAG: DUF2059 domain-containing protein [Candidatus Handelsmanbacteria bacterium]|nr:DUF2059 domain-containing protein [Candidatus Handelsmanbacteria bacterium]